MQENRENLRAQENIGNLIEKGLWLEVEIAMSVGGQFEDCMTPAQAVELVRSGDPLVIRSRPGFGWGALAMAA